MEKPSEPSKVEPEMSTGATQATDLHQSKIPPSDPRLRIDRPRSRTLRRGPVLLVAAFLGLVVAVALALALIGGGKQGDSKQDHDEHQVTAAESMRLPDVIADPSPTTDRADAGTVHGRAGNRTTARTVSGDESSKTFVDARQEELLKAREATLFAGGEDSALVQQEMAETARRLHGEQAVAPAAGVAASGQASADTGRAGDQNLQDRKNDFLARAGVSSAEYLEKGLTLPRSRYEVKAGTVIPAALITGINSDLPGQVVAQVSENVYDSVSGNFLLIPQGSRLIAAYDSMVAWGQERVLLCWNRVIRPDGSSITLDCMPGVDLAGYAGFADEVDNHWWRIIGGAALSSLLAATAQRSQGDVTGYQPSFPQAWASGTAGGINQAGQQLTTKNLQIQPTITVRPGFVVNVLVTKDIVLPPYQQSAVSR